MKMISNQNFIEWSHVDFYYLIRDYLYNMGLNNQLKLTQEKLMVSFFLMLASSYVRRVCGFLLSYILLG